MGPQARSNLPFALERRRARHLHLQQFDPDAVRRLLEEAGYPVGKGFPAIEVWLRDSPPSSLSGQAAQMILEQLHEILGIRVEILNMQANAFNRLMYEWEIPIGSERTDKRTDEGRMNARMKDG